MHVEARYKGPQRTHLRDHDGLLLLNVYRLRPDDPDPITLPSLLFSWRVLCGNRECGAELACLTSITRLPDWCHAIVPPGFVRGDPLSGEPPGTYWHLTRHAARSPRQAPRRPHVLQEPVSGRYVARFEPGHEPGRARAAVGANMPKRLLAADWQPLAWSLDPLQLPLDGGGRVESLWREALLPFFVRCPHGCGSTSLVTARTLPASVRQGLPSSAYSTTTTVVPAHTDADN